MIKAHASARSCSASTPAMAPVIYDSPHAPRALPSTSLFTWLFAGAHAPSAPAYIDVLTKRVLTRADVRAGALRLAHTLRAEGVRRGEVALVFAPNSIAWPAVLLGLIAAGAVATLANAGYTAAELAHQYQDSGARLLFVHPALLPVARAMFESIGVSKEEARKRLVIMELDSKGVEDVRGLGEMMAGKELEREEAFEGAQANETAVVCYSSGTTGRPKGVETTHRNLTSDLILLNSVSDYNSKDVFIGVLPFFHVYGLALLVLNTLAVGASVAVIPQFVPDVFFAAFPTYGITRAFIVPPIALAFVHHPAAAQHSLRTLNTIVSGAAPLSGELIAMLDKKLKGLGADVTITQGFGMTELSPVSHFVTFKDARRGKNVTIGQLLPNLRARLVADDEDERNVVDAKPGEPGELWVHGPIVMKRYLNNEKATKGTMTADGWLKTGDVAVIDAEGFFSIVDRKKELIKYKGFQVSPAELEDVLLGHPDVLDAAVIGVPDSDNSGNELPRAYVVPKPKAQATPDAIAAHVAGKLAKHKALRGGVVFIDVVPKSASGKILRRELRDRANKETAKVVAKL